MTVPSQMGGAGAVVASPAVPTADAVLIMAVVVAGVAAAFVASPLLWLATPVMATMIYVASREASGPSVVVNVSAPVFPPALQETITTAMVQVPYGEAQRLLTDVVRHARPLFAAAASAFDDEHEQETRARVAELVSAACDIALELSRLEQVPPGKELAQRYEAARQLLVKRLGDASTALGELYAAGVEQGTPASERVAELATELGADAKARRDAKTEMNQLLGPG